MERHVGSQNAQGQTVDCPFDLNSESVQHAHPVAPLTVDGTATVREVLALWRDRRQGVVLILQGERLAGIFTERDALRLMAEGSSLDLPMEKVMRPGPATILAADSVAVAVDRMSCGGYRRLPVLGEGGQPIGLVDTAGILRYLVEHFPNVVYNLPPEPKVVMQEREGA
jgi:CBS domain-containing protein